MFPRMRQLRWFTIAMPIALVLMICGHERAQTQPAPNLSGTWQLVEFDGNKDKSDPTFPKMTLVIEQDSSRITVTERRIKHGQESGRTFLYNVGGPGDKNTGKVDIWPVEFPEYESVTRRDKNRIVTDYQKRWSLGSAASRTYVPSSRSIHEQETWSVDASGKQLTLRTSVLNTPPITGGQTAPLTDNQNQTAPAGWGSSKLVFRRIN